MRRATILARRQRQKILKRTLLGVLILVSLATLLIYKNVVGKSAVGSVVPRSDLEQVASAPKNIQQINAQGNYIKFSFPDTFRQIPTDIPKAPQLETFDLMTKTSPFWELALGVSQLPSGNLRDDGSYNMRSLNTQKYKLEKLDINGQSVPVFSDSSQGFAKAAFMPHGGMLLSVALSGAGDQDTMQSQLVTVLTSIEWTH